eukprot:gene23555-28564_t
MSYRVIGLMSGTSMDGCDAVLVDISHTSGDARPVIKTRSFLTYAMPDQLRAQIKKQLDPNTSRIDELTKLDAALSKWFIAAVDALLMQAGLTYQDIDLIGSHGQTMWHDVNTTDNPMTWQLGDGSFIAAVTGITTVCDFRTADVAVGGQGAPLIPFFDQLMYGGGDSTVALQNIGGIGNVTLVPSRNALASKNSSKSTTLGFDTGPGNMIIDRFVEKLTNGRDLYDHDGQMAAQGVVCEELLLQWLEHPFFHQKPPKSTGREQFGHAYADARLAEALERGLSAEDAVATVTALTARTISLLAPATVIRAGTTANSDHPNTYDEVDADSKEAVAFALFAFLAATGQSNHLPATTGASRCVLLGKICPGANYQRVALHSRPAAIVQLMSHEDQHVASVVASLHTSIAQVAERMATSISQGGRVFYVGAGSSGRLGVLDASEIPPTFSAPAHWFTGVIAGGDTALRSAVEGAEDHREFGSQDLLEKGVCELDVVIGMAASGKTPYVHGALQFAKETARCAYTVLITCNPYPTWESYLDTVISAVVGPELITGSTRLKAGTATKLILNQLSTTAMILLGKTYGNLMVDVKVSNNKLRRRAIGIVRTILQAFYQNPRNSHGNNSNNSDNSDKSDKSDRNNNSVEFTDAYVDDLLVAAGGQVKVAIVMQVFKDTKEQAEEKLRAGQGRLSNVIGRIDV